MNPDFFVTRYHLAWLYSHLTEYQNAITELTKGRLLAGDDGVKTAATQEVALSKAFAIAGAQGFWQQIQRENEKFWRSVGEFDTPQVYARPGEKEKALEALQRNYEERVALGTLLNVDSAFDTLRSDQRFRDLVQRMGLAPNTTGK